MLLYEKIKLILNIKCNVCIYSYIIATLVIDTLILYAYFWRGQGKKKLIQGHVLTDYAWIFSYHKYKVSNDFRRPVAYRLFTLVVT